jgi:hypothetical protein
VGKGKSPLGKITSEYAVIQAHPFPHWIDLILRLGSVIIVQLSVPMAVHLTCSRKTLPIITRDF